MGREVIGREVIGREVVGYGGCLTNNFFSRIPGGHFGIRIAIV